MQPVAFPESAEMVSNDFTRGGTGSRIANGTFLTPGDNSHVFYCTTRTVARAVWR
jgi:hypothetical protein